MLLNVCGFQRTRPRFTTIASLAIVSTALGLTACGGTPVTPADYSRAEAQIREADEVDASTLAGEELYTARTKLASARDAEREGDNDEAIRLLREAEVHAQLAEARAMTKTRLASLEEVNRGLEVLRRELELAR